MKAMKSVVVACLVGMFALAGVAQAGPGGCCSKAQKEGKACAHACCVEAAKEGKWCTKCGGEGAIPKKKEEKKDKEEKKEDKK